MIHRRIAVCLPLLVALLMCSSARSDTPDAKAPRMKGVTGVYVLVEELNQSAKDAGLSRDQLKVDLELRLRQLGIKVLSDDEWNKSRLTAGMLYLNIAFLANEPLPVYSITLDFKQDAVLLISSQPLSLAQAVTWSQGCVGTGRVDYIRQNVNDYMSRFLNDFLEANPKSSN